MNATALATEDLSLVLTEETHVRAPLETTFAALLEEMGPHFANEEGKSLSMKIEARPGGRWYRDLGNDNGHLWGVVQAIKRPTLLEISGPLFMSNPVANNLQYRLREADGGTVISFRHAAFGVIPAEQKEGMTEGWTSLLAAVRKQAEAATGRAAKK
jgi:uncharacterized protein YndB with AHSA1/START domain